MMMVMMMTVLGEDEVDGEMADRVNYRGCEESAPRADGRLAHLPIIVIIITITITITIKEFMIVHSGC